MKVIKGPLGTRLIITQKGGRKYVTYVKKGTPEEELLKKHREFISQQQHKK
jgi:hypothetical protein